MKTIVDRFLIGAGFLHFIFVLTIIIMLSSCTTSRNWYSRSHDGCQQSSGFAGYGNK